MGETCNAIVKTNQLMPSVPAELVRPYDEVRATLSKRDAEMLDGLRSTFKIEPDFDPTKAVYGVIVGHITPEDEFGYAVVGQIGDERFVAYAVSVHWFDPDEADDSVDKQPANGGQT